MREIEGLVCTVRTRVPVKQEMLFGPNTESSKFNHQRFTTNDLTPFVDDIDARHGLEGLRNRKDFDFTHTGLALVKIKLTSSDDEWELLRGHRKYIIVAGIDFGYLLLGRKLDGIPGVAYAPVSNLELNGFKTINDFDRLTDDMTGIAYEVRRQGRPYTSQIATFEMQRLIST